MKLPWDSLANYFVPLVLSNSAELAMEAACAALRGGISVVSFLNS